MHLIYLHNRKGSVFHFNLKQQIVIMLSSQQWVLLVFGFLTGLLAVASTVGLSVSMVKAIIDKGKGLLTHCTYSVKDVGSSSITYECPFDPTRIYVS